MSGATSPTTAEAPAALELDDKDVEPRTPMKRLGSTRKLAAFNNIRMQLAEQCRVLDARAEATQGVLGELHEYCRRRADLEHEYARALDKLAKAALQRHKDQKHKRQEWELSGAHTCWQAALDGARALSRDHAALAALYAGPLHARLQRAADTSNHLHRKSRDMVAARHEEVMAALCETAACGKLHARAAAAWRAAADKLRRAHAARREQTNSKKLKQIDKHLEKRRERHSLARGRALRARADYVLSLEAANATLQRYYRTDIADIMLCTEVGVERVVGLVTRCMGDAERALAAAACASSAALSAAAGAADARADQQRVVEQHAAAFSAPAPLQPAPPHPALQDTEMAALLGDACEPSDDNTRAVRAELQARLEQLEACADALRLQCVEQAKTLHACEAELLKQLEGSDESWDVQELFGGGSAGGAGGAGGKTPAVEIDTRREQEDYYLQKFRGYMWCAGRLARLEGKAGALREKLLGGAGAAGAGARGGGHFATPLSGDRLPPVLTACVRVIATYGLKQQGIFRVSGSVCETAVLRAALERGEDALAGAGAGDVNAVCALLKQYVRALQPPLLPPAVQDRLLAAASLPDEQFCAEARAAVALLPRPSLLVLRYLFAFFHHLTLHSAHNMMDAWNLAVCVGPTLLPGAAQAAAQLARQNLANELLKRVIAHHARVFPQDVCPDTLYRPQDMVVPEETEGSPPESDRAEGGVGGAPGDVGSAGRAEGDEPDAVDAMSLYRHDDTESDDSDEESGEWNEDDSVNSHRRSSEEAALAPLAHAQEAQPAPADQPAPVTAPETHCSRLADTPDLVLDLPLRPPAPPAASPAPSPLDEEGAGTADTFLHNRDTLKKKTSHKHSRSEGSAEAPEESAPEPAAGPADPARGSPAPARHTARVCAQFAALTLTGGARPPAAPALLRRPTPHPHPRRHSPSPTPRADST